MLKSRLRRCAAFIGLICGVFLVFACAPETARAPDDAQVAPSPSVEAEATEDAFAHLDTDLPAPQTVMELTRRALAVVRDPNLGFTGWVIAATDCYESMNPTELTARIYCLQLDAAAYALERSVPQAWQDMDAASNDYFTPARFEHRQLSYAPPADASLAAEASASRKRAALRALALALNMAMEEAATAERQ